MRQDQYKDQHEQLREQETIRIEKQVLKAGEQVVGATNHKTPYLVTLTFRNEDGTHEHSYRVAESIYDVLDERDWQDPDVEVTVHELNAVKGKELDIQISITTKDTE